MGANVYVYEFRDFMPIDVTKIGDDGDGQPGQPGWQNYDSCYGVRELQGVSEKLLRKRR